MLAFLKALLILFFGLVIPVLGIAQDQGYRNIRYEEDYSFLRRDTMHSYDKFKFIELSRISYLSLGGEVRYQTQGFKNENWGDGLITDYMAFFTRFLFHADLHLGKLRFFSQINSTFSSGRPLPNRTIDENRLGIHQAFLELGIWRNILGQSLLIRLGRQEMKYGSERLITVREGPNNRLSFDAGKILYRSKQYEMDAFYGRPVNLNKGVFDDQINRVTSIWSFYGMWDVFEYLKIDHYYIGFENQRATFNGLPADREIRHSVGFRGWGVWKNLTFDLEGLYQYGRFGDQLIKAYTVSGNLKYKTNPEKLSPEIGLKSELISGDRLRSDQLLNTFNPLFPRGAYFGLAAIIGPVNLVDIHPSFKYPFSDQFYFSIDYDLFWRYSIEDGIYGPNVKLLYDVDSNESKIGNQLGVNFEYQPNRSLSIVPEFTWFHAKEYLKEVSQGKDVLFAALTVQYKY